MKSLTKPALRVVPAAQVQLSLNVQGVLREVQHAFYGLCVNAGKQVLAAMMEANRVALCGAKNVPDAQHDTRVASRPARSRSASTSLIPSACALRRELAAKPAGVSGDDRDAAIGLCNGARHDDSPEVAGCGSAETRNDLASTARVILPLSVLGKSSSTCTATGHL